MIAGRQRPVLAEDDLDVVEAAVAVVQLAARHRGAPAAGGAFGEAEIDRLVLRKGVVERDVEQAALAGGPDLGHALERRRKPVRPRVTMRMRPGRSVTSMRPSGRNASAQGWTRPLATVSNLELARRRGKTGVFAARAGGDHEGTPSTGSPPSARRSQVRQVFSSMSRSRCRSSRVAASKSSKREKCF